MSNHLAVATVTAAIERLLQSAVEDAVPGAKAVLDRPDTKKTGPLVNVFLYETVSNASLATADLPSRRPDGSLAHRPRAALDLHYLLTFHGNEGELEPQRLYGTVVRAFLSQPVLSRALVEAVVAAAGSTPAKHPSLVDSDLAAAEEPCRISPLPLDLEQMSKLWGQFPQTAYLLSSTWSVSPVVVESAEAPLAAAPVLSSTLTVSQVHRPALERVEVAADPTEPLTAGTTWRLLGTQLSGDRTLVRVAGLPLEPQAASATELRVDVGPGAQLRAGRVAVEVVHQALVGEPPEARGDVARSVHPVTLHPRVLSVTTAAAGEVQLTSDVPVRRGQRAGLRLLTPATGELVRLLPTVETDADSTEIAFAVPDAPSGTHAVVLTVDAADSPLQRAADGTITGPVVTLP